MIKKKTVREPLPPGVKCHIHNRSSGAQVIYNSGGKMVEIPPGQTLSVAVTQGTLDQLREKETATKLYATEATAKSKVNDGVGHDETGHSQQMPDDDGRMGTSHTPNTEEISKEDIQARLDEVNQLIDQPPANYAEFKARAKRLFGDAWPGNNVKKDEVVALLNDSKIQLEALLAQKSE